MHTSPPAARRTLIVNTFTTRHRSLLPTAPSNKREKQRVRSGYSCGPLSLNDSCILLHSRSPHGMTWTCGVCGAVVPTRDGTPPWFCNDCGNSWNDLKSVSVRRPSFSSTAQDTSEHVTRVKIDADIMRRRSRRTP